MPWPGGIKSCIVSIRSINWYIRVLAEMCRASRSTHCIRLQEQKGRGAEWRGGKGRDILAPGWVETHSSAKTPAN